MIPRSLSHPLLPALACLLATHVRSEITVTADRLDHNHATATFGFPRVPRPWRGDAAEKATFTLIDGRRDENGGDLSKLHDGTCPANSDQPPANFFFGAGTDGGRLLVDLGQAIEIQRISTYSWHDGPRGPQVYQLYAADGKAEGFVPQPKRPVDPASAGWKLLARVDTRAKDTPPGGQYGANITNPSGSLGSARYLLLDIARTDSSDIFGNTFFSEIDIIDRDATATGEPAPAPLVDTVETEGGAFRFTVDTTETPDLTDWSRRDLIPALRKWYPLIVNMLPGKDYRAPGTFRITFTERYKGVAATMGTRIECDPSWYRGQLQREAIGSLVHELVHVVQQYGRARRPGATQPPVWLTEGIADYIRWYLYEPQSKGCEISPQRAATVRHDASYRVSANFLHYVVTHHHKDLIRELNSAMREGRYRPELWQTLTGKPVEELAAEWKRSLTTPPRPGGHGEPDQGHRQQAD